MIDLSTKYLGLTLPSPLIVGSCGLTNSLKGIQQCEEAGAGAVVLKSIFEEQIVADSDGLVPEGEGSLWHTEAYEYIRDYGHESAVSRFLDLVRETKKSVKIPVIASVHCLTPGSWIEFITRLQKAGADAIELNVNVLSSDTRLTGAEMESTYFTLAETLRKVTTIPVSLKIGYHFSSMAAVLFRLSHSGIKGLVLFNRPFFPDFDIDKMELMAGRAISGTQEYLMPLRWISMVSGRAGCDLCASTGVHDGKTAVKMLLAGASSVQVVSALYDKDIAHLGTMNNEIRSWMEQHGHQRIADFQGHLRQSESHNPAAYERVQFMRHSVGIE